MMESKWFWILLTLLLLEGSSNGCLEHERVALLQLKSFFNDPHSFLINWVDVKGSACCHWERVECSNTSRRVIGLSLNFTRSWRYQNGYLNASLFLPFEELKSLDLYGNYIAGFVDNEGLERLSLKLNKLKNLDLGGNNFNDSILVSLSTFSSLKSLYLSGNQFTGSNLNYGLERLSSKLNKLKNLDLSDNNFNDSILSFLNTFSSLKSLYLSYNQFTELNPNYGFKWLSGLNNLETLDLSGNHLKNNFLLHVGGLSSLKTLSLRSNELNGSVDIQELNSLTNLRNLDLSYNQIESFQSFQGNRRQLMLNLEVLDLSGNRLQNSTFRHIISGLTNLRSLNIEWNHMQGSIDIKELNNLAKLKKLYMSGNKIESLRSFQESERQLKLIKLEELDLSDNLFNNSVVEQLSGLSNLKSLYLRSNQLEGSMNIKELEALNNLEELDLSYNESNESFLAFREIRSFRKLRVAYLDGVFNNGSVSLLQVVEAFSSVKNLFLRGNYLNKTISTQELHLSSKIEKLILDYSHLSNNFIESIGALTSLKSLMLSNCGLTGTLPAKGWCDLRNLKDLDISYNALVGTFPSCLDNLTYLHFLDISSNHFEVPASFISFANYSQLKFLFIDQNNLVREPTFQNWASTSKFQLKAFSMSNCTKGLPKELPNFLYYQYDLRYLGLSYNNFGGKLPSWLLENNTRLQQLFLMGNSFTGTLQFPRHTNVDMFELDMSQNKIQGQIPMNVCSTFPQLEVLSLSHNVFEGKIPPCLSGLKVLSILDLSYNNFSGGLRELARSNSLETLRLSNNNLSGKIMPEIFTSTALSYLYLDGNNFNGEIPLIDISNVGVLDLSTMDLSDNHLSGRIPIWIWNVSNLETLDLSNNQLDDLIPFELCYLDQLRFLDLSRNNLSGFLPSCFNPSKIQHVHLSKNRLSGPLTRALFNSSSLVTLDLAQNNLTGKIPYWIGTLSALSVLILKANHFEGEIPSQLCQLNSISIMDLSQNKLFGHIPSCLSNLTLEPKDKSFLVGFIGFFIRILEGLDFESKDFNSVQYYPESYVEEQVEFTTKKGLYIYSGNILKYMSGIDLSCNKLTGKIPEEIGNLSELHSLNLSHNNLVGFIPSTFSKLKQIESLDLSNNNLSGIIPIQLMELNYLAIFNVSYNNLSGSIPCKAQFATFDESSYMENPFLYGLPLHKNCIESDSRATVPNASDEEKESDYVDKYVLYVSFWASYGMVLMGIATVLYINPYWQQVWFFFIEHCITTCHFFIMDIFLQLSKFRRSS